MTANYWLKIKKRKEEFSVFHAGRLQNKEYFMNRIMNDIDARRYIDSIDWVFICLDSPHTWHTIMLYLPYVFLEQMKDQMIPTHSAMLQVIYKFRANCTKCKTSLKQEAYLPGMPCPVLGGYPVQSGGYPSQGRTSGDRTTPSSGRTNYRTSRPSVGQVKGLPPPPGRTSERSTPSPRQDQWKVYLLPQAGPVKGLPPPPGRTSDRITPLG